MDDRRTLELSPFGSTLTVQSESAELIAEVEAGLGQYPATPAIGGALHVSAVIDASMTGPSGWPAMNAETDQGLLTVRCGETMMVVDKGIGQAALALAPAILGERDALRLMVEGAFTATHVHGRRLCAVHSALVTSHDRGMMLRGVSGAGKSTITYSCMTMGMGIVSDDWLYGSAAHGPAVLTGYPWRMMLTTTAAEGFPELRDAAVVAHPSEDRWKIPITPPVQQQVVQHAVDAVVFIEAHGDLAVDRISGVEAAERFWGSALPTERDSLTPGWVDQLLDRPCFVLRRGATPCGAAQAVQRLAQSLR